MGNGSANPLRSCFSSYSGSVETLRQTSRPSGDLHMLESVWLLQGRQLKLHNKLGIEGNLLPDKNALTIANFPSSALAAVPGLRLVEDAR